MTKIIIDIATQSAGLSRLKSLPGVRVETMGSSSVHSQPRDLPCEIIADADILACVQAPRNHELMRSLKLIQLAAVGYSQLYGLNLVERGVRVCNARGVFDTAIAEWNIAMMMNLARDLRGMVRNQEQGAWQVADRFANEIRGSVLGLWGYGGIGRETARLAKALGLSVHALVRRGISSRSDFYAMPGTGDPEGKLPDRVFTAGQEQEFLSGLDFLVLAMPLTPANTGRIGEPELRALKPTAFLLNPARGPLVQEPALLKALDEGWIAGAALDTHYYYPMPPEHPLWRYPKVIMTPHVSGSEKGPHFLNRIWEIVNYNVRQFLAGQPLWNELTPAELKGEQ